MDIQIISIVTGSILALCAFFALIINYRNRPIIIQIKKDHTADLKDIAEKWKDEIAPLRIDNIESFIKKGFTIKTEIDERKYEVPIFNVQSSLLFSDFYLYHIPKELHIRDVNVFFLTIFGELWALREDFLTLTDVPLFFNNNHIANNFRDNTMAYIIQKVENPKSNTIHVSQSQKHGDIITFSDGVSWDFLSTHNALNYLRDLKKVITDPQVGKIVKTVRDKIISFNLNIENLILFLTEIQYYPILPGKCRYLSPPGWHPLFAFIDKIIIRTRFTTIPPGIIIDKRSPFQYKLKKPHLSPQWEELVK